MRKAILLARRLSDLSSNYTYRFKESKDLVEDISIINDFISVSRQLIDDFEDHRDKLSDKLEKQYRSELYSVKIIKCSNPFAWYASSIGSIYTVFRNYEEPKDYCVVEDERRNVRSPYTLAMEDCKVLRKIK
jgi:hypothetical protein